MTKSGDESQRERDVWWKMCNWLGRKCGLPAKESETSTLKPIKCLNKQKFLHLARIKKTWWWWSFIPVQLIVLIQASVSLKAECSALKQHLRPGKAILPNQRHNCSASKRFSGTRSLSGVCPLSQRRWRVSHWPWFLFMLLDFLLLKLSGAPLFAPHLLTINSKHTNTHTRIH